MVVCMCVSLASVATHGVTGLTGFSNLHTTIHKQSYNWLENKPDPDAGESCITSTKHNLRHFQSSDEYQ